VTYIVGFRFRQVPPVLFPRTRPHRRGQTYVYANAT